jgi:hypothetical protein
MTYIPKNKIKNNLYTLGGEFVYASNNEEYIGDYYKLYNGKTFTGKTPNDPNSLELKPLLNTTPGGNNEPIPTSTPYSPILPTPQDYKNGEFIRYFVCRRNEPLFIEIDKANFTKYQQKDPTISWKLYKPFSLFWVLTGDINQVAQTNRNVTKLIEVKENVLGLSLYLKENWTQYYKSNP